MLLSLGNSAKCHAKLVDSGYVQFQHRVVLQILNVMVTFWSLQFRLGWNIVYFAYLINICAKINKTFNYFLQYHVGAREIHVCFFLQTEQKTFMLEAILTR